jgi:hypothetical protein
MKQEYKQRVANDCGLAMISAMKEMDYATVANHMGYTLPVKPTILSDLKDNPYNHFKLFEKLGINYQKVTLTALLNLLGQSIPDGKIAVLIHGDSIYKQHWILVESSFKDGLWFYWGDGTKRFYVREQIIEMVTTSFPNCIYQIDTETSYKMNWWERLLSKIF